PGAARGAGAPGAPIGPTAIATPGAAARCVGVPGAPIGPAATAAPGEVTAVPGAIVVVVVTALAPGVFWVPFAPAAFTFVAVRARTSRSLSWLPHAAVTARKATRIAARRLRWFMLTWWRMGVSPGSEVRPPGYQQWRRGRTRPGRRRRARSPRRRR